MKRFALFGLSLLVAACTSAPAPPPAAAQAPAVQGVQVETDRGTLTLSTFSLGLGHQLPVKNVPVAVPKVGAVKAFVVNLPNASGADARLYWVNDPDLIFSNDQQPLASSVTPNGQAGYSISAPALSGRTSGYAMLVLKSPGGGPERYYAVGLGAS